MCRTCLGSVTCESCFYLTKSQTMLRAQVCASPRLPSPPRRPGATQDVARMLVRMSLDVNLCSDLLEKQLAAKQNCVASHRPSTEHPLKPFEVVGGKALRAKLTILIGL